jgi:hypothetical protein
MFDCWLGETDDGQTVVQEQPSTSNKDNVVFRQNCVARRVNPNRLAYGSFNEDNNEKENGVIIRQMPSTLFYVTSSSFDETRASSIVPVEHSTLSVNQIRNEFQFRSWLTLTLMLSIDLQVTPNCIRYETNEYGETCRCNSFVHIVAWCFLCLFW